MRVPVFSRGSNPRVHAPILRKSLTYCEDQVLSLNADWVSFGDKTLGIICREVLYFGPRRVVAHRKPYIPDKLPICEYGTKFQEPQSGEWQETHGRAGHALRTRARMTLKGWRATVKISTE